MPELPDVVVYLEALDRFVVGRELRKIRVVGISLLKSFDPPISAAEGRVVVRTRRLGKRLVLEMDGPDELYLVIHLMVAGQLRWRDQPRAKPPEKIGLAAFDFDHGTLLLTEVSKRKRASRSAHRLRRQRSQLLPPVPDRRPGAGRPLPVPPPQGRLAPQHRRPRGLIGSLPLGELSSRCRRGGRNMSSFSRESTAEGVVDGLDLSGQVFMITGTTSGLGEESARVLAARGARIAMLARNAQANLEAADRIRSTVPDANLSTHQLDLSDLSSVESFAAEAADHFDRIDVLMNNAGVMCCPFGRTADGFEMQFGTNHLGHFALTARLMPLLRQAENPRVVTLSSGGHRISDVDLADPNFEHTPYDPWVAYGRSKTANIHFAAELARRFGDELLSLSVHPGAIPTKLGRHMTKEMIEGMRERAKASSASGQGLQYKTLESGAATQVWAATAAELADQNGKYLADCNVAEPGTGEIGYAPHIYNPPTEAALWDLSERLVDLSF